MITLRRLTFKKVLRLFELCEFDETSNVDSFALKLSENYQELMSMLEVESSELMTAVLKIQKQIFEYCGKLSKISSKGGTDDSAVPSFYISLCNIKFSSTVNFNCTAFDIDNALFVDVIDNVAQFLQVKHTAQASNRVRATDDDLF